MADLESGKDPTSVKERIARVLSGKSICLETEWRKSDGDRIPVEISARVADDKRGIVQVVARDISARKRREEEKLRIEKLESIGIAPETRAIVSSGYSEDPVMTAPLAHGFQASLPKPYTSFDLKRVLAKVLSGEQQG